MKSFVLLRWLGVLVIFAVMVSLIPFAVRAATTQNVTITATPSYISISNAPTTWAIGAIAASATSATAAEYFVITNTSSIAINVSIWSGNFTGGAGWTLAADGAPASMVVGIYAGTVSGTWDKVVSASPGQVLKSIAASVNQSWHMKLFAPTVYTDGVEKTGTVTLSAAAA